MGSATQLVVAELLLELELLELELLEVLLLELSSLSEPPPPPQATSAAAVPPDSSHPSNRRRSRRRFVIISRSCCNPWSWLWSPGRWAVMRVNLLQRWGALRNRGYLGRFAADCRYVSAADTNVAVVTTAAYTLLVLIADEHARHRYGPAIPDTRR